MDRRDIGARVRRARLARGWTLEQAAEKIPCSVSHLNDIEHERRRPSADMLAGMAKAFGVSADYLLGLTEERSQTLENYEDLTAAAHANPPPEGVDLAEWEARARRRLEELIAEIREDWERTKRQRGG